MRNKTEAIELRIFDFFSKRAFKSVSVHNPDSKWLLAKNEVVSKVCQIRARVFRAESSEDDCDAALD